MKEKILKILFSISAGFGLTILVAIITALIAKWLGAQEGDVDGIIALVEGTLAFGIFSSWVYNQLKK